MGYQLDFTKMHGAGNDFIVMDGRKQGFPLNMIREKASLLCNRRTGIGADGLLILGPSDISDYHMHYFNSDGSEAGMCGNGARCLAMFASEKGFPKQAFFKTDNAEYRADVHDHYVSIYFPDVHQPETIQIENESWCDIHTGTRHVVSISQDYAREPVETFRLTGKRIRNRADLFPDGTNVNFAHILDQNRLKLVTYERGVEDVTPACGTGAIATAITHTYLRQATPSSPDYPIASEHHIQIECPGGPLEVSFGVTRKANNSFFYNNIILHGPAVSIYNGSISI